MTHKALCRKLWEQTKEDGYKLGRGYALKVSTGIDKKEHYVCLQIGKGYRKYRQYTIPDFINELKAQDQKKAREVFSKWL